MTPKTRTALIIGLLATAIASGQSKRQPSAETDATFRTDVPAHFADIILGRPTDSSIAVSVRFDRPTEFRVCYRLAAEKAEQATAWQSAAAGTTVFVELSQLKPSSAYQYRIDAKAPPAASKSDLGPFAFHTARKSGEAFTFTITADSHLDSHTVLDSYAKSLTAIAAEQADFNIDLGDTFMTEKRFDFHTAAPQYPGQRYWFGQFARSSSLFLVLGNHDGEFGWASTPDQTGMADWSYGLRLANFPMPTQTRGNFPFYTVGPKQNYYAWTWGDAQFIVLDPFWPQSTRARGLTGGAWSVTLGKDQYDWLTATLAGSKARRKFVFIHHLVGGYGRECRGGAEASKFFEWGGQDAAGTDVFAAKRPGWAMPIHDLLKRHNVTAVFHGHDHLYARQERDGIAYIAVPQPSAGSSRQSDFAAYSYTTGTLLGGGGYLRVNVKPEATFLEYVSTIPASRRDTIASSGAVRDSLNLSIGGALQVKP